MSHEYNRKSLVESVTTVDREFGREKRNRHLRYCIAELVIFLARYRVHLASLASRKTFQHSL